MILADFHIHSSFSADSETSCEEHIKKAIERGLKHICFTDHIDYDYPTDDIFEFDTDAYIKAVTELKLKYRDRLDIGTGIELGLRNEPDIVDDMVKKCNAATAEQPYDFIIGSTHIIKNGDPYYDNFWDDTSDEEALQLYFESIYDNVRNYSCFDVYGHPDYIVRYFRGTKDYSYKKYADLLDEILKKLIYAGKGIEVNTAGLYHDVDFPHPKLEILKRYRELGGEIITIGSDSHKPDYIGYGYKKTGEILEAAGFRYYSIFKQRKPSFLPL